MPFDWLVRSASLSDLEAVLALEQECAGAPRWSRSLWQAILTGGGESDLVRKSFVADSHRGVIGFAVVRCAAGLAELESVVVSSTERRRGVGNTLCRKVMDWSIEAGAQEIELEVRASSESALALYHLLGFVEQGRRREYYHDPTEDAVLMAARLQRRTPNG